MGGDAGDVDEAAEVRVGGLDGFEKVAGAGVIGGVELGFAAGLDEGGGVDDGVDAGDGGSERGGVGDVADGLFVREREPLPAAGAAEEGADVVALGGELLGDVGAEEAGGAGDEDVHRAAPAPE